MGLIVVAYKDVGKAPVFMKVENSIEAFENLLNDQIETIPLEDFVIIYKKHNLNLQPNIWVETNFLSLGETIRGPILLMNKDKAGNMFTLSREQVDKVKDILDRKAFKSPETNEKNIMSKRNRKHRLRTYENERFSDNNNSKENNTSFKNPNGKLILERNSDSDSIKDLNKFDQERVLALILRMQADILKFIKENSE